MPYFAGYRVVFACDMVASGNPEIVDHVQKTLRRELHAQLGRAFNASGLDLSECHLEERGDGLLAIAPPEVSAGLMIAPLAGHIDAELRRQHEIAVPAARIRLRIAVHAGEVYQDEYGASGRTLIDIARLIDAPALKACVRETGARTALIISDQLFQSVIRQDPAGYGDPATFRPLPVALKETNTTAWIHLFGTKTAPAPTDLLADLVRDLKEGRPEIEDQLDLARRLLDHPCLSTGTSRSNLINSLPAEISVKRQLEPLLDIFCLLQACLEHPAGISHLSDALRSCP
ncbi:MAG: hypothetical protein ABIS86_21070 [Streptosporangiaceae bacterium]